MIPSAPLSLLLVIIHTSTFIPTIFSLLLLLTSYSYDLRMYSLRSVPRLDYKALNDTGERIVRSVVGRDQNSEPGRENLSKMDEDLVLVELRIKEDLKHSLEVYALEDLYCEEDINEGSKAISELCSDLRHVHVTLKSELDANYTERYPDYPELNERCTKYLKDANLKAKIVRNVGSAGRTFEAQNEQQEMAKVSKEVVEMKLSQLRNSVDLKNVNDIDIVDGYISKLETLLDGYIEVSAKFRVLFKNEYDENYKDDFAKGINGVSDVLKMAGAVRRKLKNSVKSTEAQPKLVIEPDTKYLLKIENLSTEITVRAESLATKFDCELSDLTDHQILDLHQNKSVEIDFNDILSKVTDLSTLICESGGEFKDKLDAATKIRDHLTIKRKDFVEKLQTAVTDRDISPDKLKNAATIKIDLPKFSGYDCKIDLYTFQSKFKTLIEPHVQKPYWADYLKYTHLEGQALLLVEGENDYSKIWEKLHASYGNTRLLLQNKLSELEKIGGLWKVKGNEKLALSLSRLLNTMRDLGSLAKEHKIEGQLYEGGGLEKVMSLIGTERHKRFRIENLETPQIKKLEWDKLSQFLQKELKLRNKLVMDSKSAQLLGLQLSSEKEKNDPKFKPSGNLANTMDTLRCSYCGGDGHIIITTPRGNKIIPYYVCERFVTSNCKERYDTLKGKNLCTTCLFPGAKKGPKHRCYFKNFCCPNSHNGGEKIHILLCDAHKSDPANSNLLVKYKEKFVEKCTEPLPLFSKQISFFSEMVALSRGNIANFDHLRTENDISESAIFQIQIISIPGTTETLTIFFDGGCGGMCLSKSCVDKLSRLGRALKIIPGPLPIVGVNDQKSISEEGVYSICLTLHDGREAELSGLCLTKITQTLPAYDLTEVEKDIRSDFRHNGPANGGKLPKLPKSVGGDTDILLGACYRRYFPKLVHECDSGLGIYESSFKSPDGSRGVVTGPHKEFSKTEQEFRTQHAMAFNTSIFHADFLAARDFWDRNSRRLLEGYQGISNICPDETTFSYEDVVSHLGLQPAELNAKDSVLPKVEPVHAAQRTPVCIKHFDALESAGTEITYRCEECRTCQKCIQGPKFESISIETAAEQELIEKCVTVDADRCESRAKLPFLVDPIEHLSSNESQAFRVFQSQVNRLQSKPEDRAAAIESEKKLQDLNFVGYFDDLSEEEKELVMSSMVKYFIPWRVVFNENSLSTPCRLVFDASLAPKGGRSLNSILAKGANSLNNLVQILIRWTTHPHAFHTDISKMYNRIWLVKEHWCYQLYLWSHDLDPDTDPVWKVIKTLIYGVRPSGQLAECALRRAADLFKDKYPRAWRAIHQDTYMDDNISGSESPEASRTLMDEFQITTSSAGFVTKGFVCSGEAPPENMSIDGKSVLIGGLKWFTVNDTFGINVKPLNFSKKVRGKRVQNSQHGVIPDLLTKLDCVSKMAELNDPLGRIAPIIAGMKLDRHLVHQCCVNWDDPIPNELKNIWIANFDLMQEIGTLQFSRAVVPSDAVSLDVETIDIADAGEMLICAAIYARFERRDGTFSCQLIFSRTKIVHDLTTPRAELEAAVLNASTGHVVKLSLNERHKRCWKITDSQVTLHWLNCRRTVIKPYVRNRKIEVNRLTNIVDWFHTKRENNIADLGTRKGAKLSDVDANSDWINGLPWMRGPSEEFPIQTVEQISLSNREKSDANQEMILKNPEDDTFICMTTRYVPKQVGERYKFSNYLIDPNRFRFRKVVRILTVALLFILKASRKIRAFRCLTSPSFGSCWTDQFVAAHVEAIGKFFVAHLTQNLIGAAKAYFFRKTTLEVKQFVDARKYEKKSVMKDDILYH